MKKFLFFLPFALFGASITLKNDSPYTLGATVISNAGITLTSMSIEPNDVFSWSDSYGPTQPGTNVPYSVIWTCPSGADYGVSYNIGSGATTTAQESAGARYCHEAIPKAGP